MAFMKYTRLPAEHTEDEQKELERAAMFQPSFDADCPEMGEEQLSQSKSVQQFQTEMESGMREGNLKGWLSGAQVRKRIRDRTEDRLSGATLRMMDESIQNMRKGKTSEAIDISELEDC